MNKADEAVALFSKGFNCSQAVCAVFCEELGLDREAALKVSCGFGGGMRQSEVCGAVTGAFMALGLKYGQHVEGDMEAKEKTYAMVKEFSERFADTNGSIICGKLLGCDLKNAKDAGLFSVLCPKFVRDAVEIAEKML